MAVVLASAFALAIGAAVANAQPYGYRHGFGHYGPGFSYGGTGREQMVRGTGN
jgi:hypothetical protein